MLREILLGFAQLLDFHFFSDPKLKIQPPATSLPHCPVPLRDHRIQPNLQRATTLCEKFNSRGHRGSWSRVKRQSKRRQPKVDVVRGRWKRGKFNDEHQQQAPAAVPPPPSPVVAGGLRSCCSAGGSLPWNSSHIPGRGGGKEKGGSCGNPSREQKKVRTAAASLSFWSIMT